MTEIEQTQYQWYWHQEERGIGMSGGELLKRTRPDAGCRSLKMRKKERKKEEEEEIGIGSLHETFVLRSEIWLPT